MIFLLSAATTSTVGELNSFKFGQCSWIDLSLLLRLGASRSKNNNVFPVSGKHPTSQAVKRDTTVRSRVKEAVHSINKDLDLINGNDHLSAVFVDLFLCCWKMWVLAMISAKTSTLTKTQLVYRSNGWCTSWSPSHLGLLPLFSQLPPSLYSLVAGC